MVAVSTSWLEGGCDGVAQGWRDARKRSTALLASQTFAASPMERKGPASPPGQSCTGTLPPLSLNVPFPWACVHSAAQGIFTNHGEFSSKALGIFIRLGNDAFTHAVFGKGSLLSSCLGLGRAGGRVAAAREPRQSRQLLLASPGVHAVRGKSRGLERAQHPGAAPAPFPAA